jgi:hypothetical protein
VPYECRCTLRGCIDAPVRSELARRALTTRTAPYAISKGGGLIHLKVAVSVACIKMVRLSTSYGGMREPEAALTEPNGSGPGRSLFWQISN